MTTLFTDLDNTVIYSHRHEFAGDKVWIETLHNRPQSFMTVASYRFYQNQAWLNVVPVTTRTKEQYARLRQLTRELNWNRALICNGAILLQGDKEDKLWREESLAMVASAEPAFHAMLNLANSMEGAENVISVEPFLFYIKTARPEAVCAFLRERADLSYVTILKDARKVYCLPRSLHKGNAVVRYKKRFGSGITISAGDSDFDIPMLRQTDISFCPESLKSLAGVDGIRGIPQDIFSDGVCKELEFFRKKGVIF